MGSISYCRWYHLATGLIAITPFCFRWTWYSVGMAAQRVNSLSANDAIQRHGTWSPLLLVIACCLFSTKPSSGPMLKHSETKFCQICMNVIYWRYIHFLSGKCIRNVVYKISAILFRLPCVYVYRCVLLLYILIKWINKYGKLIVYICQSWHWNLRLVSMYIIFPGPLYKKM